MKTKRYLYAILSLCCVLSANAAFAASGADLRDEVEHHFADSNGTKIHYVAAGEGPLVVMIHGFPDFWYSWRHQMAGLKADFRVIAIDQRGYNKSGQPEGVDNYAMQHLVSDVAAVIKDAGAEKATIVGHDWGGAVAWQFAFALPQMTERLIVLNLPHPVGMARELATNPEQQKNSGYAQKFREGSPSDSDIMFGGPMSAQTLAGWVTDPVAKSRYEAAFSRSSFAGMLNFYKANYPQVPEPGTPPPPAPPILEMPTLVFHGLKDRALHSDGLNNTWDWINADLTIVTTPDANHFVQNDAAELVTTTMKWWLLSRANP
ncbi:MAG: alpha/beta fold hydrolase [Pseudomonadales bacterium]|nr:alpha/beta fold hydrolase [Pseudomonadales bacterium]